MKSATVRKLHRWIGLLFSVSTLTASVSGVFHTIMSRTQAPPPIHARPEPIRANGVGYPLEKVLSEHPGATKVDLRMIRGEPWYQVTRNPGEPLVYVSATDGRVDATADEVYAKQIAETFLGNPALEKTDYLTAFDREYIAIFRILPVYRFACDDGRKTRVYVSTSTGTVTRHTDRGRQFEADVFSLLHKLAFIPDKTWRDWVLVGLTSGIALVSVLGIVLFFATRPRRARLGAGRPGEDGGERGI
jgi:hypothetical protein